MYSKMWKQSMKYMTKHVWFSMYTHLIAGIGVGIILARPLADDHPLRWGISLVLVAVAMHIYSAFKR